MANMIGIVNMTGEDIVIDGLSEYRSVSSTSLLGRYRLVDFVLSNMSNSGINQIQVYVREKPRSIIEHIGSGRYYNINSKRGKIRILTNEAKHATSQFNHDVNAFAEHLRYMEDISAEYVVIAPSHFIFRADFNDVLNYHIESEADVTIMFKNTDNAKEEFLGCDCLTMNNRKQVVAVDTNRGSNKQRSISLETYIMKRDLFVKLVKKAQATSSLFWFRDIVVDQIDDLDVRGYSQRGFVACINSIKSYYKANMDLKSRDQVSSMFDPQWPIYTRTNDSPPARYGDKALVSNAFIANGCSIEGTVINSVIGRGTVIKEGAVVKDCVVLAEGYIESGVHIENAVVDKWVKVKKKTCIKGLEGEPLYIKKYDTV